jgi:hypothetical protein
VVATWPAGQQDEQQAGIYWRLQWPGSIGKSAAKGLALDRVQQQISLQMDGNHATTATRRSKATFRLCRWIGIRGREIGDLIVESEKNN